MKHVRIALLAIALLFLSLSQSIAQNIHWNNRPHKGFVFEISNNEALHLLTKWKYNDDIALLLHTQVDTFDTRKGWETRPAQGHFIMVEIVANEMHCEYTCVFPYQVFLFNEYGALSLQVLDKEGIVREDAIVKLKRKRIRINPESKTYRLDNAYFRGNNRVATVELDGFRSIFNVSKHEVPTWQQSYNYDEGPDFYSYMITDKNKYKPNETVRFKSYALNANRWPLRKDLEMWIRTPRQFLKICNVEAHRPGSYAGEFTIHDSLKLKLDQTYFISLRDKNGRSVANCQFYYEDYELFGNKLELKLDTYQHFHEEDNTIIISATDVNGLRLKDASAEVLVKTLAIIESYQTSVVLKDTLIYQRLKLDPANPTKITIPSELFQKTNTNYQVQVTVLNSENERMVQSTHATHYYSQYYLRSYFVNDSICFELYDNGEAINDYPATLTYNSDDTSKTIRLPYIEKINVATRSYTISCNKASQQFTLGHMNPELFIKGGIEKDSFNIELVNSQMLDVSWYVYQGSTLLHKGFDKELEYKSLIIDRSRNYYVELFYAMGGQDHVIRRQFVFKESNLSVDIDLPDRIYPGQTVDATITVTNAQGNPIKGVDLTALATTSMLNYYLPDLPYYGDKSAPRPKSAHFSKHELNQYSKVCKLDFEKWKYKAGLDTMKYYQFSYPGWQPFVHKTSITDSTQFAPYVMKDGMAEQVYVIEVNRVPVYYSWTKTPNQYSFYVSPNEKKEVSIRLYDRIIVLDSIQFERGKKTIISLNLNMLPSKTKVFMLSSKFTSLEKQRYSRNIVQFENVPSKYAYLEIGDEFTPLFNNRYISHYNTNNYITAGPISNGTATYTQQGTFRIKYWHEGNYKYSFDRNVVYKLTPNKLFPTYLNNSSHPPLTTINHMAVNKKSFLDAYSKSQYTKHLSHDRTIDLIKPNSRIRLLLPYEKEESGLAAILFQNTKTQHTQAHYLGNNQNYRLLPQDITASVHNIIVLYNNGKYLKMDSIPLEPSFKAVLNFNECKAHPSDSISQNWLVESLWSWEVPEDIAEDIVDQKRHTPDMYLYMNTTGNVSGTVFDSETNEPIPGVCIVIKGTAQGTITDLDGKFAINIENYQATLLVSFIGYITEEVEVIIGSDISVELLPDLMELQEVVVIGYGTQKKSSVTGAISSVSAASIEPEDDIAENETPEETGETELYNQLLALNTIRSNFSDVGFWEPRLYTNRKGKSTFTVTFPDDITQWNATVYAMNRSLKTGTARKQIKSYKPIMAELKTPRFLTRGDSAFAIGKIANHSADSLIEGKTNWKTNTIDNVEQAVQFAAFHSDKLALNVNTIDTITAEYTFTRSDNYFDGERRSIPVIEQGTVRADGTLNILDNSNIKQITANDNETITLEVMDNQLNIYESEVKYLLNYRHACNEQLASKLSGLISHKIIVDAKGDKFKHDKTVNKIIERLLKNQNDEYLWSWWNRYSHSSYWMSAHILRALKYAKDNGYNVPLNMNKTSYWTATKLDINNNNNIHNLDLLHALACWEAPLDYPRYINNFDSLIRRMEDEQLAKDYYRRSFLYEKFLLEEVKQLTGLPIQRDSILKYKKESILGAVHFDDNKSKWYWYRNDFTTNLIAYRIIQRDSVLGYLKAPMQLYFIDQRQQRSWNTYQSANAIKTVLPDLLAEGYSINEGPQLKLSGKQNETISEFPFRTTLAEGEELNIQKTSGLPMYYMQYTHERVTDAKTGVEGFEIASFFKNNAQILEAGKPIQLMVEVTVTKDDADEYVMLEIPIPGACSYADKRIHYSNYESHREYHKDRVEIFCQKLSKGKHTFSINLLPRFTGTYILNPAQVSLMYFPVVNANTALKKVIVNDKE